MERRDKLRPCKHTRQDLRSNIRTQDRYENAMSEMQEPTAIQADLSKGTRRDPLGEHHKRLEGPERKIRPTYPEGSGETSTQSWIPDRDIPIRCFQHARLDVFRHQFLPSSGRQWRET